MRQAGAWPEIVAHEDPKAVEKARASMSAFDAMPAEWREICANHGRTARGESLARLLDECGGDIATAHWHLNASLPIVPPPPLQHRELVPLATYDLKVERRKTKRKRKAKA